MKSSERHLMLTKGQLLIVDDEQNILKTLERQFRQKYDVHTATSAEQAYEIMLDTPIQVIIADQRMPGITGAELLSTVKEEYPNTIRLLLTGYADINAVIEAINRGGIRHYIEKPWEPEHLEGVVDEAFETHRLRAENESLLEQVQQAKETLEHRVEERTLELQHANEVLTELSSQLETSNQELTQFAYIVSHDLQEPLRTIKGFLELIKKDYSDHFDERGTEFVDFALDGAIRLQILIKDLLQYARLTTRAEPFLLVDCTEILEYVVKSLHKSIEDSGAAITYDALPKVMGDTIQLRQLFQNLVSNAIKYRSESAPQIDITAKQDHDMYIFNVRDNGIGIAEKNIDRIFNIFQRLHTGKEYEGTGIGLAICKKAVTRHGGKIWVESEPGRGSTFYFTLPVPSGSEGHK